MLHEIFLTNNIIPAGLSFCNKNKTHYYDYKKNNNISFKLNNSINNKLILHYYIKIY